MRIFHNEAVTDEEYMRDCYSDFDLADNDGWLSLVAKLLSRIRAEISVEAIERMENDAVLNAINATKAPESLASLKSKFMQASEASELKELTKMSILNRFIKKAFHARAKVETVAYRAQNTDRHVAGAASQAFQQSLMAKTEKKTKAISKRVLKDGEQHPVKRQRS